MWKCERCDTNCEGDVCEVCGLPFSENFVSEEDKIRTEMEATDIINTVEKTDDISSDKVILKSKKELKEEQKAQKAHEKQLLKAEKERKKAEAIAEKAIRRSREEEVKRAKIYNEIGRLNLEIKGIDEQIFMIDGDEKKKKALLKDKVRIIKKIEKLGYDASKAMVHKTQAEDYAASDNSLRNMKIIFASTVIVFLVIFGVYAYMSQMYMNSYKWQARGLYNEVRQNNVEIQRLEGENETLQYEKEELESEASYLRSRVSSLEGSVSDLKNSNDEMLDYKEKADFMDRNIKVVDMDYVYHKYGCSYFSGNYWAYNKEQVIGNSTYTRCPYCN